MKTDFSLKEKFGCLCLDVPRLLPALIREKDWVRAWNRHEFLKVVSGGVDTTPVGPWSADIHACHVFPWIGKRLLHQAIQRWPVAFANERKVKGKPEVSFIIPHRGVERLPLLRKVIESIHAQEGVAVECIVVEQNATQDVEGLPHEVQHIHLPHPTDATGWHKSWAYNVGVAQAKANIVVCHDGDILVPSRYAQEIIKHLRNGENDVVHLQRFLFCLNQGDTEGIFVTPDFLVRCVPERVRQNWQGGTLAISKEAFYQIGGYDQRFVGWGGEDNEFFDRCRTLRAFRSGYLPFIHLWHEPQPAKGGVAQEITLQLLNQLIEKSPRDRIAELVNENNSLKFSS